MEDNTSTWLALADLVFIDPVCTGYSRAATSDLSKNLPLWQGDIDSVGRFIRLYLGRYERWGRRCSCGRELRSVPRRRVVRIPA